MVQTAGCKGEDFSNYLTSSYQPCGLLPYLTLSNQSLYLPYPPFLPFRVGVSVCVRSFREKSSSGSPKHAFLEEFVKFVTKFIQTCIRSGTRDVFSRPVSAGLDVYLRVCMCLLLFIIHIKVIGSCIRNQWCRPTIANNNCMEKGVGRLKKGSISTLFWMLKKTCNMPGGRHWAHSPKQVLNSCSNKKTTANHIPWYIIYPSSHNHRSGTWALKDEFTVVSKGSVFQVHDCVVITCLLDYSRCLGQEPTMIFVAILDLPFRPSASHSLFIP